MEGTTMTKQDYQKPAMTVIELNMRQQMLAGSVQTTGLSGEELELDLNEPTGDSWDDAMSRNLEEFEDFEDENF